MILFQSIRERINAKIGFGSEGEITRNMLKLITGDGFARIIGLITTPIITRIYLPDHMGVLSVFVALISIIAPLGTFRYSTAIPLPRNGGLALNLILLSFILLLFSSLFLVVSIGLSKDYLFSVFSINQLIPFWWLIPIAFFGTGLYELLSQWAIREKNFKLLAKTKVSQKFIGSGIKIVLGLLGFKPIGLLLGQIFTQMGGIFSLLKELNKRFVYKSQITRARMLFVAKWYSDFPKYRVPSQVLLMFSGRAPLLYFAWRYDAETTGQIGLAFMMLSMPMTLIGASTGKAFYAEIARIGRRKTQEIIGVTKKVVKKLFLFSFIPFIIILLLGPWLFKTIFGEVWQVAGVYARILSVYLLSQFVYSPISEGVFNVFKRQSRVLLVEVSRLLITVLVFVASYIISATPNTTLVFYSLGLTVHYVIATVLVVGVLRSSQNVNN